MPTCPHCGKFFTEETTSVLKVFPDGIIFDTVSDQGTGAYYGTACLVFPAHWEGKINSVIVNDEKAARGLSHNGKPVFRLLKTGDKYTRPLKMVISTIIGDYYKESGSAKSPSTGSNTETHTGPTYANGNRAHFRFNKPGSSYGNNIQVLFDGKLAMTVPNGAKRYEPGGGLLWKPTSDNDGKLVILGKFSIKYTSCTIKY